MHLAGIDGLSTRRWEWRSRFTPFTTLSDAWIMIQQLIFTCGLVSAPQPITSLHPLSSCTSILPSALKIRLFTTMTSLSAIPFLLNYFIISCSISISWLWASGLKNPIQTPWQQQGLLFLRDDVFEAILSKKASMKTRSSHDRRWHLSWKDISRGPQESRQDRLFDNK